MPWRYAAFMGVLMFCSLVLLDVQPSVARLCCFFSLCLFCYMLIYDYSKLKKKGFQCCSYVSFPNSYDLALFLDRMIKCGFGLFLAGMVQHPHLFSSLLAFVIFWGSGFQASILAGAYNR